MRGRVSGRNNALPKPQRFVADKDEIRPQYQNQDAPDANAVFASSIVRAVGPSIGATIDQLDTQVSDIYNANELANVWYHDQVLPFDITLAGANEYGAMCAAKILGVEILNSGTGISIDDAVSEQQDQVSSSLPPARHSRARARNERDSYWMP